MASFKQYTASGGASEAFSIPSFTSDEIKVRVDGVLKTASTHYNITNYSTNGGTVTWTSGNIPSSGTVYIYRDTKILNNGNNDVEGKATYAAGSSVKADELNDNHKQVLRALLEKDDQLIQKYDIEAGAVGTTELANDAVSTIKIVDDAVTYAKMQDISTANRVLGVASSAGEVTETQIKTAMIEDNAVTTAKIYDNAITSAKIANGTIVDADISGSAAIAGSKIDPDFGSQNVTTTGLSLIHI